MIIIANFQQSIELEQALAVLEHSGIPRKHMLVVAMDTESKDPLVIANTTRNPHSKRVEVGFASATGLAVIGASAGFTLVWGPIIWGLIACTVGFWVGFGMTYLFSKGDSKRHLPKKLPEITVIVQCPEEKYEHISEILWRYKSLTIGRYPEPD